jgi:uncharacterized protein YuzE
VKKLLAVTFDSQGPHSMYLRYSRAAVAKTQALDEKYAVNVDFDDAAEVIGIEIVVPTRDTIDVAAKFATEHGLSLEGAFDRGTMSA